MIVRLPLFDLGFGESKNAQIPKHTAPFLSDLCDAFKIEKVIMISPSMSGMYSIPFIHGKSQSLE